MRGRWFDILVLSALVIGLVPGSATPQPSGAAPVPASLGAEEFLDKVDPRVLSELAESGRSDYFIVLAEQADLSYADQLPTKEEKGTYVFETLLATAQRTQAPLRERLDDVGVDYRPFYVANMILVREGCQTLLMSLAIRADVEMILPNREFRLEQPFETQPDQSQTAAVQAVEDNIAWIKVKDVWHLDYAGEGTVLAGNDTGLDATHPAIAHQYRGCLDPPVCSMWDHNYNWWDATGTYPMAPADGHGHGTHTTGTMVGDDRGTNQIGVAPDAQTIHCKSIMDGGSGTDATFIECFEWDLAPWDLEGQNPDPGMAPDAVNSTWGYWGGGRSQFRTIIQNLQMAGILVQSSAGNEGPSCETLRSPGDYREVLTTGSVDHAASFPGAITEFSSRGPSSLDPDGYFPDIMAPGEGIRSALPGGTYASWSGTDMAGAHATALVGLMWSACPAYRGWVSETIEIIQETAAPLTGQEGSRCGGDYDVGPNHDWGFGTIDALAAVTEILRRCPPLGYLDGYVTDSTVLTPIEGATITAHWHEGRTWQRITDASGHYTFTIPAGTYDVSAEHPLYAAQSLVDVAVLTDTVTTRDFQLHRPSIAVEPEEIEVQVPYGTAVYTHPTGLDIINDGGEELEFELKELAGVEGSITARGNNAVTLDSSAAGIGAGGSPSDLGRDDGWTYPDQGHGAHWIYAMGSVTTAATDGPWFWPEPVSGTVPALTTMNVAILFTARDEDANPLPKGPYTSTLVVAHNDPTGGVIHIPVTMHIVDGPSLTIAVTGPGSGTVTPPEGTHHYPRGQLLTVTAEADIGSYLAGWTGDVVTGTETIVLEIVGDIAITATFELEEYALDVDVVGDGEVAVDPAQEFYNYGDVVTLTATADLGWRFAGWSGAITGTDAQIVAVIEADTVITATFVVSEQEYSIYTPLILNNALAWAQGGLRLPASSPPWRPVRSLAGTKATEQNHTLPM